MADRQRTVSILIEAKNQASAALSKVGLSLNGLAIAAGAAGAAMTAIIAVMAKATAAASEQEKADVRLATALASIGKNTAETRADLAEFIDGLEDATKVSDETIASVLSLLTQFGRLEGEGLKRATRATLDYAAATSQDAVSAAEQLANIIVKGQGRLKGINTIFAEGASKAERYASVLQQLEGRAEKTAEAHGKTFQGALTQVSIEMERLLELLGESVVKNGAVRDAVAQMAATIKAAAEFIREHRQEFDALVTMIGKVAEAALVAVPKMLQFSALVVQFIPGGQALTSILRLMQMALKEVETETVDAAAGIKNVGTSTTGAGEAMKTAFDRLSFDIDLLEDLRKKADDVTEAWQVAQGLFAAGEISSKQLADVGDRLRKIVLELQNLGVFVPEFGIVMDEAARKTQTLGEFAEYTLATQAADAAGDFGAALVQAAFDGGVSFSKFFRALLRDLADAIARALIVQTILNAIGLGGAVGGQARAASAETFDPFVNNTPVFNPTGGAHGGRISGGQLGLDSVAAMLMPGEIVLPRDLSRDFEDVADFASRVRSGEADAASGQGGRPVNLSLAVLGDDRFVSGLVDTINRYIERRGGRLIASEVLP